MTRRKIRRESYEMKDINKKISFFLSKLNKNSDYIIYDFFASDIINSFRCLSLDVTLRMSIFRLELMISFFPADTDIVQRSSDWNLFVWTSKMLSHVAKNSFHMWRLDCLLGMQMRSLLTAEDYLIMNVVDGELLRK